MLKQIRLIKSVDIDQKRHPIAIKWTVDDAEQANSLLQPATTPHPANIRRRARRLLAKLTDIARASADGADFELRLSRAGYHHSSVRELGPEITAVIQKETQAAPEGEELRRFLSRLFVSTFDFDQEASQDKARVLGVLRLASPSRDGAAADACWNAVFERHAGAKSGVSAAR